MRGCAAKLRASKQLLQVAVLDMRAEELPIVKLKQKLVFETHDTEQDIREQNLFKFDALEKRANEAIEECIAQKKHFDVELKRQSQQFHNVMDQRDADIEAEYTKALNQLQDEIEETTQQLELAIRLRDAKQSHLAELPPPSDELDQLVETNASLKEQVHSANDEVAALKEEYHKLENAPIKRRAENELLSAKSIALAEKKDAMECAQLAQEIRVLQQTFETMQNKSTQQHWLELQIEENKRMEEKIASVNVEIKSAKSDIQQAQAHLKSLIRTVAPTTGCGAIMLKIYELFTPSTTVVTMQQCMQ
ncbi:hypothetical protein THRCLA_04330, partial [Thraustotheca clavata]